MTPRDPAPPRPSPAAARVFVADVGNSRIKLAALDPHGRGSPRASIWSPASWLQTRWLQTLLRPTRLPGSSQVPRLGQGSCLSAV